jgi:hypothetical protein
MTLIENGNELPQSHSGKVTRAVKIKLSATFRIQRITSKEYLPAYRQWPSRAANGQWNPQHADTHLLPGNIGKESVDYRTVHPHIDHPPCHRAAFSDSDIERHAPSYKAVCLRVNR